MDTRPVYTLKSTPAVIESHDEAVERARALKDRLRERYDLGQELRRLPDVNVADILESGLYGVMKPKRYGGSELGTQTMIEVTAELASADPSTGWVYMLWAAHMWMQALWPVAAMDEMWENPNGLASSVVTTVGDVVPVDGGYRWTGRGLFSSGVDHCNWLTAAVPMQFGESSKERLWLLIPREDFEIIDDWHTIGLRGTGSKTIILNDVFIPEYRSLRSSLVDAGLSPGREVNTHPMYGAVANANFTGAMSVPAIGAAKGLIEAIQAEDGSRRSRRSAARTTRTSPRGSRPTWPEVRPRRGTGRCGARPVAHRRPAIRHGPREGRHRRRAPAPPSQLGVHRSAGPPCRQPPVRGSGGRRSAGVVPGPADLARHQRSGGSPRPHLGLAGRLVDPGRPRPPRRVGDSKTGLAVAAMHEHRPESSQAATEPPP